MRPKRPRPMTPLEPFGRLLAIYVAAKVEDLKRAKRTGTRPLLPGLHIDVENARVTIRR